jgi:hypothetical protein
MTAVSIGFQPEPILIPLDRLLPSKKVPAGLAITHKYRQVRSSVEEIGLIEPLSVTAADLKTGHHLLLDGHIRLIVLKDLEQTEALCLVAKDDEAYTYNNRLNRLPTIQEHFMIRKAIASGVPAERLAKTLDVDVSQILKKNKLLEGICSEAVELVRDRQFSVELGRILRRMKPTRQIECIELMVSANNLTVNYAEALLAATPSNLLVDGKRPRKMNGVTPEQMVRMEREMANLQSQYRLVEQSYGQDILNLVLARGYLAKLLENDKASRYIRRSQPEVLDQFAAIIEATALE